MIPSDTSPKSKDPPKTFLIWAAPLLVRLFNFFKKKIEAIVRKTHFEEFKAAHTGESHFFLKKNDFCCFLRSGLRSTKTFSIVEGFKPV